MSCAQDARCVLVGWVAGGFGCDEVLQEAEEAAGGGGEDREGVDGAVGAGADEVVCEDAGDGSVVGGAAPGGPDVAAVEADDCVRESGFEDGVGGVAVGAFSWVFEREDGGALSVRD